MPYISETQLQHLHLHVAQCENTIERLQNDLQKMLDNRALFDELTSAALRIENERLKEALEPFAVENPIGILDPWMQYFSAARALLAELK